MIDKEKNKTFFNRFSNNIFILYVLTFFLMLIGELVGHFIVPLPDADVMPILYTCGRYFQSIGIWIVFLLYIVLLKKNRIILQMLWKKRHGNNWKLFIIGIFGGFGLNATCVAAALLRGDIHFSFNEFNLLALIVLFATVLIQSSAEELVCRCFLYQRIIRGYGKPWLAIIGNSLLFGLFHLANKGFTIVSMVNIVAFGILFSLLVYYMDSMWAPIAMHTAWNYTQNILFGLPNSGKHIPYSMLKLDEASSVDSIAYNIGFGIEGSILADAVLIVVCVFLCLWARKHKVLNKEIWDIE